MPRTPRSLSIAESLLLITCGSILIALPVLTGGVWLALGTCLFLVIANWRHWRIRPRALTAPLGTPTLVPQIESRAPKSKPRRVEREAPQPLEVI